MILNNRYQVIRVLGSGGFGQTFLVEDTYMPSKRLCVLKQLKPIVNDLDYYQSVQERFQREAAVLEALGESNEQIPSLYAYFEEDGLFYLVQEWVEGQTLTEKLQAEGRLSEDVVKEILVGILPVIDYVHNQHIIHRDIKPDNIILRHRDNKPVLIDFGAVKEAMGTVMNSQGLITRSIVVGTLGYMSSEQAAGRPVYSSDVYSLGMMVIRLLTGKSFQEIETNSHTGEMLWRHHALKVSDHFAAIIDKATQCHHNNRYATAQEMLDAIAATNPPVTINAKHLPQPYSSLMAQSPEFEASLKDLLVLTCQSAVSRLPSLVTRFYQTQIKASLSNTDKKLLLGGVIVFLGLVGSAEIQGFGQPSGKILSSRAESIHREALGQLVSTLAENNLPEESQDILFTSTAENFFNRGKDKYRSGNYAGAIEDFNQVITLDPDYAEAYNIRGLARHRLDDQQGAIEDFKQAAWLDPRTPAPHNNLGKVRTQLGDFYGAIDDFNEAIRIDPKDAEAYKNRGDVRTKLGDTQGAIKDYDQALLLNANYTEAYKHRGDVRAQLGDTQGAIDDYTHAILTDKNDAIAYTNRAKSRVKLGDTKNAIEDYKKVAELSMKQGNTALYQDTVEKLKKLEQ